MTVKELMEQLKLVNGDAVVYVNEWDDDYEEKLSVVADGILFGYFELPLPFEYNLHQSFSRQTVNSPTFDGSKVTAIEIG